MTFHWIDYGILAVIGLSMITGLFRGLVKEVIALGVWIAAIWLSFHYADVAEPWLAPYVQDKTALSVAASIAVLLVTLIVGGLFNAFISFILKRTGLSGTDRILGMGFGFVRGLFIVSCMMVVVKMTAMPEEEYRKNTQLYAKFTPLVDWLSTFTPVIMQQMKTLDKNNTSEPTTDIALDL